MDKKKINKKEIMELISQGLNDPKKNDVISNELLEQCKLIIKEINKQTSFSIEKDVSIKLFASLYKSYNTFIMLYRKGIYEDSLVIARRLIETFIRFEYISKFNSFQIYDDFKYIDRAEFLRRLLQSNNIKHLETNKLWINRQVIVTKNQEVQDDIATGKYDSLGISSKSKEFPSIEYMAEKTDLLRLYKINYSYWSKMVHSNSSIEGFLKYEVDGKVFYNFDISAESYTIQEHLNTLQTVNYCVYLFLKSLLNNLNFSEDNIKNFEKNQFVFVTFDVYTGRTKSIADIISNLLKVLFNLKEEDLEEGILEEGEDERTFFKTQKTDFQKTVNGQYKTLKTLIEEKEEELSSQTKDSSKP
ncbi:DUF5677 domain-containing protein [Bacillus cereus group sp. Bce001]|uniref:DUF5677 domain-containing protein n=1 Tax=Bacillus cereus group sp. Bce001 TaxID=3445260 RepID=UPI003F22EB84